MFTNNPLVQTTGNEAAAMGGDVKASCRRYMNYHVIAQMRDGSRVEGIIEDMDDDGVTMLLPEDVDEEQELNRQYGGFGRRRFRRFRRQRFPFPYFVFPFFLPYPYYYPYPPYPYYPPYGYGGYGGGY